MRLAGKTALITGSSRNIGKAIALTFAKEGAELVLNTKSNREELEAAAAECKRLGARVLTCLADVSVPEEAAGMVQAALRHFGKLDVLVSNAAIRPHRPLTEIPLDEWHQVMAVNLHAAFYLCKAALPSMVERGAGNIIALGGGVGQPNAAAVAASKLGLEGLIRTIAAEYGPRGIRANLLMPGSTETERRHPEWYTQGGQSPFGTPEHLRRIPLGRRGRPEEVAAACLFLASDESSYVTGSYLWCNGGGLTRL